MIHRIIKEFLHGNIDGERSKKLIGIVDYASVQSSDRERVAQDAEREVDDLKKAEYMKDKIGEEYDGIISSVTSFGMFVELPNTIEGLVHISDLSDDYYIYDEKHLCLIGERTKKVYRLGDEVGIKVQKVDLASHEIYFKIAKENDDEFKENDLSEESSVDHDDLDLENIEEIHPVRAVKDIGDIYKPETSEDEE
jgi:ribonuclease R